MESREVVSIRANRFCERNGTTDLDGMERLKLLQGGLSLGFFKDSPLPRGERLPLGGEGGGLKFQDFIRSLSIQQILYVTYNFTNYVTV